MIGIWCAFYLITLLLLGYLTVSVIAGPAEKSLPYILGLSGACGAGNMGLLLFWESLIGITPTRWLLCILLSATIIGLIVLGMLKRLVQPAINFNDLKVPDIWCAVPLLLAMYLAFLVAGDAVGQHLYDWDGFSIWGLKAKVVFSNSLMPVPAYFYDRSLSFSHLDYPLMVPFLTAGVYAAIGTINDQAGKIIPPFIYCSLGLMMYSALRWKLKRLPAATLAVVAMGLPVMLKYAGSGCADTALTLFWAGSIYFTIRWIDQEQVSDLMFAILFAAYTFFTKNEGIALLSINGLILFLFPLDRRQLRDLKWPVCFVLGVIILQAPWLLWSAGLPRIHENYAARLTLSIIIADPGRLQEIIPVFLSQIINFKAWGLLWVGMIGISLLGMRAFRYCYVQALWLLLSLQLVVYLLVYLITPWNLPELLTTSLYRVLLHTTPAAIFILGYHWAEISATRQMDVFQQPVRSDSCR
jgi:hypothetical protein